MKWCRSYQTMECVLELESVGMRLAEDSLESKHTGLKFNVWLSSLATCSFFLFRRNQPNTSRFRLFLMSSFFQNRDHPYSQDTNSTNQRASTKLQPQWCLAACFFFFFLLYHFYNTTTYIPLHMHFLQIQLRKHDILLRQFALQITFKWQHLVRLHYRL